MQGYTDEAGVGMRNFSNSCEIADCFASVEKCAEKAEVWVEWDWIKVPKIKRSLCTKHFEDYQQYYNNSIYKGRYRQISESEVKMQIALG